MKLQRIKEEQERINEKLREKELKRQQEQELLELRRQEQLQQLRNRKQKKEDVTKRVEIESSSEEDVVIEIENIEQHMEYTTPKVSFFIYTSGFTTTQKCIVIK